MMNADTVLGTLLGAGCGAGLLLILLAFQPHPDNDAEGASESAAATRMRSWLRATVPTHQRLLAAALTTGIAAGAVTGWPVGGALVAAAVLITPHIVAPGRADQRRTDRVEAVAVWTEMLRDTLSAAAGLEQALRATATTPPPAVETEVRALAVRIGQGEHLPAALRAFAADLDDPTADLVVAALVLACERQARQLAPLLGALADTAREQVATRLRIDAERARVRTSVRVVMGVTVSMAVGLVVLNRAYLSPFDTAQGQGVLAVVGALFAAAFAWMAKIARMPEAPRLFRTTEQAAPAREGAEAGR